MEKEVDSIVFIDRLKWRRWLQANHRRRKKIWLVVPKKAASGISYRAYYDEALEGSTLFWMD